MSNWKGMRRGAVLAVLAAACGGGEGKGITSPPPTTPGVVARLQFVSDTFAVNAGQALAARAVPVDANGQVVPGVAVTYAMMNDAVATVATDGTVSGLRPGPTTLRASAAGISADATVEVFGHPEGLLIGSTPLGSRPFGVDVSRTGVVYVTQLDAASIARLDTSLRVDASIPVGNVPTGVTFAPNGAVAYVTNQWSQNVGVVNVATGRQTSTIPIPADPFVVFASPDGAKLFITSNTSNVFVANASSGAITDVVGVTSAPNGFALNPDQKRIYISSSFGGTVAEIDIASDAVLRTFTPGGVPQGLVVSKDGKELFVANESGWLDVYSLISGTALARIPLAGGGFGAALSPDQEHLYVSLANAGKVQVVNIPSRQVVHTIDVGGTPRRIAFTRHGGVAVIPNEAGYVSFVR